MFCTKCGKEIPDGSVCDCQQAQQQQPQQPQQPPQQQYQQQPPPQQQQYQQPPPPPQQQPPQYQPPPQQQYQPPQYPQQPPADNRKLFSILSYIPVCFLFGMLSNTKNDPDTRFHVGQGILLTICSVGFSLVIGILSTVLSMVIKTKREIVWFGVRTGVYENVSSPVIGIIGWLLQLVIWGGIVALAIMAVLNINKNWGLADTKKPLPVIGRFAFYK